MANTVEEREIGRVETLGKEGPRELKARYLIDQYNKLCSWRHSRLAIATAALSCSIAAWALFRPMVELSLRGLGDLVLFLTMIFVLLSTYSHVRMTKQEELICMLDQYRNIHKCLPENWDLRMLRYSESAVRKFLIEKGKISSPKEPPQ
mgnify:CR=1 FL=1